MRACGVPNPSPHLDPLSWPAVRGAVPTPPHPPTHLLSHPPAPTHPLLDPHPCALVATLVVFALLPLQPMMLGSAQRQFDGVLAAANREIWAFVEGQASRDLRFKGEACRR